MSEEMLEWKAGALREEIRGLERRLTFLQFTVRHAERIAQHRLAEHRVLARRMPPVREEPPDENCLIAYVTLFVRLFTAPTLR